MSDRQRRMGVSLAILAIWTTFRRHCDGITTVQVTGRRTHRDGESKSPTFFWRSALVPSIMIKCSVLKAQATILCRRLTVEAQAVERRGSHQDSVSTHRQCRGLAIACQSSTMEHLNTHSTLHSRFASETSRPSICEFSRTTAGCPRTFERPPFAGYM